VEQASGARHDTSRRRRNGGPLWNRAVDRATSPAARRRPAGKIETGNRSRAAERCDRHRRLWMTVGVVRRSPIHRYS
jgi:hypothetical protein